MKYRLTKEADTHIAGILRTTKKLFGPGQVRIYSRIIADGIKMIAEDPLRPSSFARDDLRKGVRSFHLELVSRRRHSASHILYFMIARNANGEDEVIVIAVLHERMEPRRRLGLALRGSENPSRSGG